MVAGRAVLLAMVALLAMGGLMRVAPAACCAVPAETEVAQAATGCCHGKPVAPTPAPTPCEGRDVCPRPCCDAAPVEQDTASAPRAVAGLPEPVVLTLCSPAICHPRHSASASFDRGTTPRPPTQTPLHLQLHILLI
jgi:hypothetical protein